MGCPDQAEEEDRCLAALQAKAKEAEEKGDRRQEAGKALGGVSEVEVEVEMKMIGVLRMKMMMLVKLQEQETQAQGVWPLEKIKL